MAEKTVQQLALENHWRMVLRETLGGWQLTHREQVIVELLVEAYEEGLADNY